jgi:hypothetical protein
MKIHLCIFLGLSSLEFAESGLGAYDANVLAFGALCKALKRYYGCISV